jgi:hypothetical protein
MGRTILALNPHWYTLRYTEDATNNQLLLLLWPTKYLMPTSS